MHHHYTLCVVLQSFVSIHTHAQYLTLQVVLYFLNMDVDDNFGMSTISKIMNVLVISSSISSLCDIFDVDENIYLHVCIFC